MKKWFTLVELIIVIAIIWILVAALMPAIYKYINKQEISNLTEKEKCEYYEYYERKVLNNWNDWLYFDKTNNTCLDRQWNIIDLKWKVVQIIKAKNLIKWTVYEDTFQAKIERWEVEHIVYPWD